MRSQTTSRRRDDAPELGPHISEVAQLALAVGQRLGLPEHSLHRLPQAAELHDIGKMAIPDAVLDKSGPLDDEDRQLIREHTVIGERMLAAAPALRDFATIVRATHERFDGAGYPDRIGGGAIPIEARIITVTDSFHAMTSERPYRKPRSLEGAIDELQRCSGTHFDPTVVDILLGLLRDREPQTATSRTAKNAGMRPRC